METNNALALEIVDLLLSLSREEKRLSADNVQSCRPAH